jgi:uncharacterized membrane protein
MFRYIKRHDPWLIVLNFGFLLCIALMFAPISFYAAYYSQSLGARIYFGIWQTVTALLLVLTWWRAAGKRRLLDHAIADDQIRRFGARVVSNLLIIGTLLFVALSPAIHPGWYLLMYLAALGLVTLVSLRSASPSTLIEPMREKRVQGAAPGGGLGSPQLSPFL